MMKPFFRENEKNGCMQKFHEIIKLYVAIKRVR